MVVNCFLSNCFYLLSVLLNDKYAVFDCLQVAAQHATHDVVDAHGVVGWDIFYRGAYAVPFGIECSYPTSRNRQYRFSCKGGSSVPTQEGMPHGVGRYGEDIHILESFVEALCHPPTRHVCSRPHRDRCRALWAQLSDRQALCRSCYSHTIAWQRVEICSLLSSSSLPLFDDNCSSHLRCSPRVYLCLNVVYGDICYL